MTTNRRAKQAIRVRMAESGEKYTEARRALGGSPPADPDQGALTDSDDGDLIGWFTDQAYNAILLAEDEARMLGRPRVAPEHLLLAASRFGNVERMFRRERIDARAIHTEILRLVGWGDELVLGPVPRDTAAQAALWRAVEAATDRGIRSPSTQHLLLGLAGADAAVAVLRALGIVDAVTMVDSRYPAHRPPLAHIDLRRLANVAHRRSAPRPGPMPPVFERFTVEAHAVIDAAIADTRSLKHEYVTPVHILVELLRCEDGVAARARADNPEPFEAGRRRATELLAEERECRHPAARFNAAARQLVADDVLAVAHRLGHRPLTTGHLLVALLSVSEDEALVSARPAFGNVSQLVDKISALLPGDEHL